MPPDQIPEGLLNLARRHRSSIEHLRVVISDDANDAGGAGDDGTNSNNNTNNNTNGCKIISNSERDENKHNEMSETGVIHNYQKNMTQRTPKNKKRKYLVLISFSSSKAATLFVQNLNGKPYNSFERDVIASVHHVAKLENDYEEDDNTNGDTDTDTTNTVTANNNSDNGNQSQQQQQKSLSRTFFNPTGVIHKRPSSTSSLTRSISSEKQNCPVCLEPMENYHHTNNNNKKDSSLSSSPSPSSPLSSPSSSSIFTTVCNHSFHTECLLQCQDSPCPVCRYDHSGLNDTLSQCYLCGTTENIHVCLICGVASCWNNRHHTQPPSSSQWGSSSGTSASRNSNTANRNNRHDLDFMGNDSNNDDIDLIKSNNHTFRSNSARSNSFSNKDDHNDKKRNNNLPNSCDPRGHAKTHYDETLHAYALDTETQHVWDFAGQGYVHRLIENVDDGKIVEVSDPRSAAMERSTIPELSDTQEGEVVHRKLEGYANQYHTLLKSQLQEQRIYYESIMDHIRHEHARKNHHSHTASELISALKQDRNQLQQRCVVLQKKRDKVKKDVVFLKNMNESLEANKEPLQREIMVLQKKRRESEESRHRRLLQLQDKLQSLMLELESGFS